MTDVAASGLPETSTLYARLVAGYIAVRDLQPDKPVFVIDDAVFTYNDLAIAAERAGLWLQSQSRQYGLAQVPLRIACRLENCFELAVWYLVSIENSCLFILMDPGWSQDELAAAVRITQPDVMVEAAKACESATLGGNCFVAAGMAAASGHADANQPIARWCGLQGSSRANTPSVDLFFSGFTSGSSGNPKAFVRTVKSWLASFEVAASEFGTCRDSVILAPGPLSHGLSFFALAETFYHGATFFSQKRFNPRACYELLHNRPEHEHRLTTVVLVPSMLVGILDIVSKFQQEAVSFSRANPGCRVITAGAKLDVYQRQCFEKWFPHVCLSEYYGASELSFVSISHAEERPPPESVGRLCKGVSARVQHNEEGVGLIEVAGGLLASGYLEYQDQKLVVSTIVSDDGYATVGDRGYFDPAGFLFLVDRDDRMFNSGGLKVFPSHVERIAADYFLGKVESQQSVNCVVVGLQDQFWGQRVCLVLQCAEFSQSQADQHVTALLSYCRSHLQRHEVPRRLVFVEKFPMTTSGKIAYHKLYKNLVNNVSTDIHVSATQDSEAVATGMGMTGVYHLLHDADSA